MFRQATAQIFYDYSCNFPNDGLKAARNRAWKKADLVLTSPWCPFVFFGNQRIFKMATQKWSKGKGRDRQIFKTKLTTKDVERTNPAKRWWHYKPRQTKEAWKYPYSRRTHAWRAPLSSEEVNAPNANWWCWNNLLGPGHMFTHMLYILSQIGNADPGHRLL